MNDYPKVLRLPLDLLNQKVTGAVTFGILRYCCNGAHALSSFSVFSPPCSWRPFPQVPLVLVTVARLVSSPLFPLPESSYTALPDTRSNPKKSICPVLAAKKKRKMKRNFSQLYVVSQFMRLRLPRITWSLFKWKHRYWRTHLTSPH